MVGRNLQLRPSLGPLKRVVRAGKNALPPLNFITIHYAYFIITCLVFAIIFWGSSTPTKSVSFTDSLFLVVSAMTMAGLNTVNLSSLNTFQQVLLFLLILFGGSVFVSAFVLHVRRKAFENKFQTVVERRRRGRSVARLLSRSRASSRGRKTEKLPAQELQTDGARDEPPSSGNEKRSPDRTINFPDSLEDPVDARNQTGPNEEVSFSPRTNMFAKDSSDLHRASTETYLNSSKLSADRQRYMVSDDHISFSPSTVFHRNTSQDNRKGSSDHRRHSRLFSMQGVGAISTASLPANLSNPDLRPRSASTAALEQHQHQNHDISRFLSSSGRVSRNSTFFNLTEAERERLGGVEYRAVRFLSILVPLYFVLWQLLGCIGLGAWVANHRPTQTRANGINPWWVGVFNGVSAFNNSGMSLLDANMIAFQDSYYMLITMGLMILAGNTCYPIFLRLIVWTLYKLLPSNERWNDYRSTLRFLLDHPRRCYTNLFPSEHTWWLLLSVISLNGVDWAAFEILNIGNKDITGLPHKVIDGLFQAFAVRSGGFYVVPIPSTRISLQLLYVIMMYISVYPVVITMRNSNVYEERSLGIYSDDPGYDAVVGRKASVFKMFKRSLTGQDGQTKSYFVRQQLRAQLAHDLWWIALAVFIILIVEGSQFTRDPATYSVFNVIFEVVSGYGTVGISVGLPNEAYSFCGGWHVLSKLILCAVMLRGRHRGLPVAIDKAVMLPGEDAEAEEEDAALRLERTVSRGGMA